jgi:hypothetical protein
VAGLARLFRRADLPGRFCSEVFTKRTLRFAWDLITLAGWDGFAAGAGGAARRGAEPAGSGRGPGGDGGGFGRRHNM